MPVRGRGCDDEASLGGNARAVSTRRLLLSGRCPDSRRGNRLASQARGVRSARGQAARRRHAAQGAPAVHLVERAGSPPTHPRRGRGRAGPRPAVLEHHLLHQGGAGPGFRLVAPGCHLLGPVVARRHHRLGSAVAGHAASRAPCAWSPAATARSTPIARPGRSENLLSRGQEVMVDIDAGERRRHPAEAGRDLAASRAASCTARSRTAPSTGASALPSATFRPICTRPWPARATAPPWCAASIATVISTTSRRRDSDCRAGVGGAFRDAPSARRRSSMPARAAQRFENVVRT